MPLPQADPDVFESKSGGGCASLFGLPFLLAGIAVAWASIAGAGEGAPPLLFGLPFGAIFALVGGLLVFGRSGLRIDRRGGSIEKWSGLLRPMRIKRYSLKDAAAISLSREVRRSNKSSHTVYPVRIALQGGGRIDVSAGQARPKARREAETLAKFLNLPLDDLSDGEPTRRQPHELDQSLRDRFRAGSLAMEVPEVPAEMRSRVQFDGARLEIDIPPSGFRAGPAIVAAIAAGFGCLPLFFILGSGTESGAESVFLYAFAALFAAIPMLVAYGMLSSMFLTRERIVVTPDGLSRARGWLIQRSLALPADRIEEIRLGRATIGGGDKPYGGASSASIALETDEKTVRLGSNLDRVEAAYLLALIRSVLAA